MNEWLMNHWKFLLLRLIPSCFLLKVFLKNNWVQSNGRTKHIAPHLLNKKIHTFHTRIIHFSHGQPETGLLLDEPGGFKGITGLSTVGWSCNCRSTSPGAPLSTRPRCYVPLLGVGQAQNVRPAAPASSAAASPSESLRSQRCTSPSGEELHPHCLCAGWSHSCISNSKLSDVCRRTITARINWNLRLQLL